MVNILLVNELFHIMDMSFCCWPSRQGGSLSDLGVVPSLTGGCMLARHSQSMSKKALAEAKWQRSLQQVQKLHAGHVRSVADWPQMTVYAYFVA